MKLNTFTDILRSGNLALGTKLSNLLTEDCTILEYTNDSVLFSKGAKLVLAKFKHPLTESRMTSTNIIDNEVIELSEAALTKTMRKSLNKVIDCVISENLVDAQENLDEFCQTFYQMAVIKNRYPEVFAEQRVKSTEGFGIRQEAKKLVSAFKVELFTNTVVNESVEIESTSSLIALVESDLGKVLALGKTKVKELVVDALLGDRFLAESVTNNLYVIAEEMDSDSPVGELRDKKYDLEKGKFDNEYDDDIKDEEEEHEIPSVPTEKDDLNDEDEVKEFTSFNPAMFSEEDIKQLHKTTLKSILLSMQEFVRDKAASLSDTDTDIPADLGEQIESDLEALDDEDVADDRLSEIEARWNPMISYFLDSSYHTPADELTDMDSQSIDEQLPPEGEEDSTSVDNVDDNGQQAPAMEPGMAVNPQGPPQAAGAPPAPLQ